MSGDDEVMEFQVKVPVCVTLYLKRDDASWMNKDDLAAAVGAILEAEATENDKQLTAMTDSGSVSLTYQVNPHWDNLPADEVDLVYEDEEGFFPVQD